MTPELAQKVAEWQRKCLDGTITPDDMKEAVLHLRAGRISAAAASAKARKPTKDAAPAAADMLDEMGDL